VSASIVIAGVVFAEVGLLGVVDSCFSRFEDTVHFAAFLEVEVDIYVLCFREALLVALGVGHALVWLADWEGLLLQ
jgi:hypothetical protein